MHQGQRNWGSHSYTAEYNDHCSYITSCEPGNEEGEEHDQCNAHYQISQDEISVCRLDDRHAGKHHSSVGRDASSYNPLKFIDDSSAFSQLS